MSDQTPTASVPNLTTAPDTVVVDEAVAKTAIRISRAKTFLKSTFKNVGVPVLIGSAAAYVVSARNKDDEADSTESNDTATN